MFSTPQYTTSELQQYNYFVMQEPVFEEKIEGPVFTCVYEENGVLYCASSTSQGVYYYTYALNNPLIYTDPSGYFADYTFLGDTGQLTYEPRSAGSSVDPSNSRYNLPPHLSLPCGQGMGFTPIEADPNYGKYFNKETGQYHKVELDFVSGKYYYREAVGSRVVDDGKDFYVYPVWGPKFYIDDDGNWNEVDSRRDQGSNWPEKNKSLIHRIGAFGFANSVKGHLIVNPWMDDVPLAVTRYSNFSRSLGIVGGTFGIAVSGYNIYNDDILWFLFP